MINSLHIYVLLLTDGGGRQKPVPFLWDGLGDETQVKRQVVEENGDSILGEEEKADALEYLADLEIVGPWTFQAISCVHPETKIPLLEIPFSIAETSPEVTNKRRLQGNVRIYLNWDLAIHIEHYGVSGTDKQAAENVALELWQDKLRALVWPDLNSESPVVVDMEKARIPGKAGGGNVDAGN